MYESEITIMGEAVQLAKLQPERIPVGNVTFTFYEESRRNLQQDRHWLLF